MSGSEQSIFPKSAAAAVPAYRAEQELRSFLPDLLAFVPAEQTAVLIDGIYDNSLQLCSSLGVEAFVHEENRGKGAALSTLFEKLSSDYEWIITMDADGQHSPDDLSAFINAISTVDKSCGIICGSRSRRGSDMPLLRRFSNSATSLFISLVCGQKIYDSQCGFRAYRSSAVKEIHCRYTRFEMESEILIRAVQKGYTIQNVPVKTVYNGGPSHISHVKDTLRWIRAVFTTLLTPGRG